MFPASAWIDSVLVVITCLSKSDNKNGADSLLTEFGPTNSTAWAKFSLSPP